jgi:hypothetical protein
MVRSMLRASISRRMLATWALGRRTPAGGAALRFRSGAFWELAFIASQDIGAIKTMISAKIAQLTLSLPTFMQMLLIPRIHLM